MSAFILDNAHIDAIVSAAIASKSFCRKNGQVSRANANEVGKMLQEENYASVNCRYDENETPEEPYQFIPHPRYGSSALYDERSRGAAQVATINAMDGD